MMKILITCFIATYPFGHLIRNAEKACDYRIRSCCGWLCTLYFVKRIYP